MKKSKEEIRKGVYLVVLHVKKDTNILVGSLGKVRFRYGYYVYCGSAQNNLRSRIERHLSRKKKRFWHIDYLLSNKNVEILNVICFNLKKQYECMIAKELYNELDHIKNFGCSDCKCASHLFYIKNRAGIDKIMSKISNSY